MFGILGFQGTDCLLKKLYNRKTQSFHMKKQSYFLFDNPGTRAPNNQLRLAYF